MEDSELHTQAKHRLEDKRGFWNFAVVFVLVSALLVAIWAISGSGYFWPVFPIAGMGIALAIQAWNVYGQKPVTRTTSSARWTASAGARPNATFSIYFRVNVAFDPEAAFVVA